MNVCAEDDGNVEDEEEETEEDEEREQRKEDTSFITTSLVTSTKPPSVPPSTFNALFTESEKAQQRVATIEESVPAPHCDVSVLLSM